MRRAIFSLLLAMTLTIGGCGKSDEAAEACSRAIQRQLDKPDTFTYVADERAERLETEALMAAIIRGTNPALLAANDAADAERYTAAHRDSLQNWIVSYSARNALGGASRKNVMCVFNRASGAAFVRADDL
jgi:hypothetical protein